jgi:hypothetical protein
MSTVIQKAVKGQRNAMELLYEANKQKVFYVSLLLLGNEVEASRAASYAFKNVWGSMTAHGITTEEGFTHLAIRAAVDYCKRRVARIYPKAFRIPSGRNFLMSGAITPPEKTDNPVADVLNSLPELQRFLLVLHTAGGYTPDQIASAFKFDMKTVDLALDAEKANIERVVSQGEGSGRPYESIVEDIRHGELTVRVPDVVDAHAAAVIDGIAAPMEKKRKKRIAVIGITAAAVCLCIIGIVFLAVHLSDTSSAAGGEDTTSDGTVSTDSSADTTYTPAALDESLTYYADIEIADYGTVTVQLDQASAPVTAANFVSLAESGFYDGLTFHRIMEGFMMQGGDPNGDGTGGSENTIVGEFADNGYENSVSHTRGAISMARSGDDYDSASSQFFIVQEDSTYLDGQYAVFGYVTEGLEVVDAVCEAAEPTDDNGTIEADAQPVITSITIRTE